MNLTDSKGKQVQRRLNLSKFEYDVLLRAGTLHQADDVLL